MMSKYRVVNFSGTPYGTPTAMQESRQAYINTHLSGPKNYAFHNQISTTCNSQSQKNHIFSDTSVVDDQLNKLIGLVDKLNAHAKTMDERKQQQAILHMEQVIGRITRILNRPENLTPQQKDLYLDNLQETLKLAEELSIYEHGNAWTWREIGRLLIVIAGAAAITAIVSYFVLSSAPIAITVAVCSALLADLGFYLLKFSSADSLKETLSDVVRNVKPFPADEKGDLNPLYPGYCNIDGSDDNDQNGYGLLGNSFDRYLNEDDIYSYLSSKVFHSPYFPDRYTPELTKKIRTGLENRLNSGDNKQELLDQLPDDSSCEKLAALSDVASIPVGENVFFISMEELIAEGDLDPLGAENPTEALKNAFDKVAIKAESQSPSLMTTFTHAVNAVYSFFGASSHEHDDAEQEDSNHHEQRRCPRDSLPRERFRDFQVPEINSLT
ncbi:MAG: hypothetical protein P1U36_09990 [Legionellaceae bacterium]|nr:hypothetical protein [Legionellaceae bacterium]